MKSTEFTHGGTKQKFVYLHVETNKYKTTMTINKKTDDYRVQRCHHAFSIHVMLVFTIGTPGRYPIYVEYFASGGIESQCTHDNHSDVGTHQGCHILSIGVQKSLLRDM